MNQKESLLPLKIAVLTVSDLADGHISMNPLKIRTIAILKSRNINSLMKMRSPKYKF